MVRIEIWLSGVYSTTHEILAAQRIGEESVYTFTDHVNIGVVIQRHDAAGRHQHIFCQVHQLIACFVIGTAFYSGEQDVISFGPSAVFDLDVIAVRGKIQIE